MKLHGLIAAFICFAAFAGNAAEITFKKVGGLDIPPEYRTCHKDLDCMVVEDICSRWGWHPINKVNLLKAEGLFKKNTNNCLSDHDYPRPETACIKNSCVIAPDAGNCIFRVGSSDSPCRISCNEKNADGVCILQEGILPDEQP